MTDTAEQVKAALLDAVVELADHRQPKDRAPLVGELLRHYFGRTAPQDLTGKDPIDLYAATIRHLELGSRRDESQSLVRVYNPDPDEDGWSSPDTVIDVVGQDMPFIVDSVLAALQAHGLQVHMLVHPLFTVERSPAGELVGLAVPQSEEDQLESVLHIEVDRVSAPTDLLDLQTELLAVLADVRVAVEDWMPMRARVLELAAELDVWAAEAADGSPRFEPEIGGGPAEAAELLRWLEAGAFTFIGYREYDLVDDPDHPTLVSRADTGMGVLRQAAATTNHLDQLPSEIAALARRPTILNLTKANQASTVHRRVPLDYVGIKEIDETGRVIGERRLVGLFASTAYTGDVARIPSVRAKVNAVIERAGFHSSSHDQNRLLNILQTYPRDELFQINVDELEDVAQAILDLRDRRQVSLLVRREQYGRFLSCLVFVPRDRHSTEVRLTIQRTLMDAYGGRSIRYSTEISDAPLARLHLVIYIDPSTAESLPDASAVEARLVQVTRTWDDYLRHALIEARGQEEGLRLLEHYGQAFEPGYRSNVLAEGALHDIARLETVQGAVPDVSLYRPLEAARNELRCKIYCADEPISLSRLLPMLHDFGALVIDEHPYVVDSTDGGRRYIYDIGLEMPNEPTPEDRSRMREAILAVWRGEAESDGLARLVISADLDWREVSVLRACARYLVQIGGGFSYRYITQTLIENPTVAAQVVGLFTARFDVDCPQDRSKASVLRAAILESINTVVSLDADRILRRLLSVVDATVRTNHWQLDLQGKSRPALALKLIPGTIPDLPKPAPAAEIFVYSPRTEGVHLRSGPVARGGLRWSERMEDYRTEILGLMKAQAVKNSVIVPVGAKGGFVARSLPVGKGRDEVMAEVVACYQIFVGALLDVTDNVVDGETIPPADLVRLDGDDPYLVVAADKGTATFSDTANGMAQERGFWLDDAFASGGSDGYDHKALAITARGAWVSVERHFRELGLNSATTPFSVVGIGDMSGDVFGNGMLLSDQIRLIAAFDHRHIFVDPDPDPATSFAERQRLFDMDRSSWADYDLSLISPGGGVFERSAKSVRVSDEMRAALGITGAGDMTPELLMRAILVAPVDLLWNGGIGTYIKATSETNAEVGDRANDGLRVDAKQVRAKVIAEGGNLGVSQRGRIEFARHEGRVNTDAIDNSGGVDSSDHEVNLKILLAVAERNGDMTRKQRNVLLESMADEVCDLVLATNYEQNETLSAALADAPGMVQVHDRLMDWLEQRAGLDRTVESLPTDVELATRSEAGEGLTRPELAVLLAYTKNMVTDELLQGPSRHGPVFEDLLLDYFPSRIRAEHEDLVRSHPLRDELIAMLLSNDVVDRGGISMIQRLSEETSATVADICLAHLAAWKAYDLATLWDSVRALDGIVVAATQTQLQLDVTRLGERATRWLLRNEPQPIDVDAVVEKYRAAISSLGDRHAEAERPDDETTEIGGFVDQGVPRVLAEQIAALGPAFGFLDLSSLATSQGSHLADLATLHSELDERLELSRLRRWILALPREDHWETMARGALRDQYFTEHAELTATAMAGLRSSGGDTPLSEFDDWLRSNEVAIGRCMRTFAEIEEAGSHDLAHASVAVRALTQLRRSL